MPSLRDHLIRTAEVRYRNLSAWMAPALGERATPLPDRFFEEAALTVLAHVFRESGPIREQLVYAWRRRVYENRSGRARRSSVRHYGAGRTSGIATRWSSWSTTSIWWSLPATPFCSFERSPSSSTRPTSRSRSSFSASPGLFGSIRGAHEPLVRFFEPITLGPLELAAAAEAITNPLTETDVTFDDDVVAEIVELSGGRPYYLQKLAYFAFDAAEAGRVGRKEFTAAFERAFASVSLEIFAARWSAMAPAERQVVSVVASASVARLSGEIEGEAARHGIAPAATRQALHRLAARGHIDRLANGQRGRYAVRDRLFRRYLELQGLGR
jgi:hypothetical protein